MEKIKLKLGEVLQLESEINGYIEPKTNEVIFEGFTKQNLSIILKYELSDFSTVLKGERTKVDGLRDELIKKHGEDDGNGGIMVKMYLKEIKDENDNIIGGEYNPKYLEFDKEYGTLLNQEIDLEYPEITKEDLKEAGKSKDKYQVLFKLIKKEVKKEGAN
jgi:hypothetical protein